MPGRMLQWLSTLLLIAGIALLAVFAHHLYSSARGQRDSLNAFDAARQERQAGQVPAEPGNGVPARSTEIVELPPLERSDRSVQPEQPDTSAWSESRRTHYDGMPGDDGILPEGVMRIPSVNLEVPVFTGTGEYALTRGAGRIEGTPVLGEPGNTGIAAHRDGWFRALKDVRVGDAIEIETLQERIRFRITETFVVDPSDVQVLAPTAEPSLTLVTCYPFYFIGSAPQRYIVRAVRT